MVLSRGKHLYRTLPFRCRAPHTGYLRYSVADLCRFVFLSWFLFHTLRNTVRTHSMPSNRRVSGNREYYMALPVWFLLRKVCRRTQAVGCCIAESWIFFLLHKFCRTASRRSTRRIFRPQGRFSKSKASDPCQDRSDSNPCRICPVLVVRTGDSVFECLRRTPCCSYSMHSIQCSRHH